MTRCIASKTGGSAKCGGDIKERGDSETLICAHCRRVYTPTEILWIDRVNAHDDMLAAKKEQEQSAAREERKKAAKGRGRSFA